MTKNVPTKNATPRTDAVEREHCGTHTHHALLMHARQLERELDAMTTLNRQHVRDLEGHGEQCIHAWSTRNDIMKILRARGCAEAARHVQTYFDGFFPAKMDDEAPQPPVTDLMGELKKALAKKAG